MACEAPFEPTGYIGCAASPSNVTRPNDQRGSGSRSHIGYSQNSGVAAIKACASTWRMSNRFMWVASSSVRPARDQSSLRGGSAVRAVTVEEIGGDAGVILAESAEAMAGVNALSADAFAHRVVDHALQPAAMNRKLRHVITGVEAARLAPDLLAEAIGVEQLI